jgi:mono/diheme cytochrome c family protein/glucose/arabinose dehydrogenase
MTLPTVSIPRFAAALAMTLFATAHAADNEYSFQNHPDESLDVLRNGRLVARYMMAHDASTKERRVETYKPFLHVFDAEGKEPITKGAGGEFTHHRGIFIGWNKMTVNGKKYDRWHMPDGEQVHERLIAAEPNSFTSIVKWNGVGAEPPILQDARTFTFLMPPAGAYACIDVVSRVKAIGGATELDGDPEHSGLQFRPANEVERKETVYLYPVENAQPHKDLDYPWIGETFTLRGKKYSVVYLNHPANPKGGRISAYRDYGRFGVFWKASLAAGATQEFRARFIVAEGAMLPAEAIQKAWNEYTGAHDPVPKTTTKPAEAGKSSDIKTKDEPKPEEPAKAGNQAASGEAAAPKGDAAVATPTTPPAKKRAGGGPEQPELKFRPPPPRVLTAQEELATLKLPAGFHAELVASEPMIETPIAMSWDDQGRLYVVEMRGYMLDMDGTGEDQPLGRVSRLEDTNGDGVYDKATVFADKLVMPRAVMALGDGALIAEPPNLTFYHDTNGDGVADKSEPVSDKFATRNGQPEHMANSPTWMMDNWIWSSGHSFRYRWQQGVFLTEMTSGFGQWGRTQDDWGRQFFNYNSDFLRCDLVAPAYYARNPRVIDRTAINYQSMKDLTTWPAVPTPGVNRGYDGKTLRDDGTLKSTTGTCGAAIYRGDLFPEEFRGNVFIPEPCGLLIKRLILNDDNGVVTARNAYEGTEFLTSTDERFRPVNCYTGPDGALYVCDIARGLIQHKAFLTYYLAANTEDRKLETPVGLGRIYRIVPDGAKPQAVKLPRESAAIVPLLTHANGWVRDTAQRVLVERGDRSVAPAVKGIARTGPTPQVRAQALWTLEGLGALTPDVVAAALKDAEPKVRVAAIRAADKVLALELAKLASDPSTEVRVQLAYKLSEQPGLEPTLITLLRQGGSPLLGEAVATGFFGRELEFLELLAKEPDTEKIAATGIFPILGGCVMRERRAARVTRLLDLVATFPAPVQLALLEGMAGKPPAKNAQPKPVKLDAAPAALAALIEAADPQTKPLLARIDAQVAWPGKAGYVEKAPPKPLSKDEQVLFDKGKMLYAAICGACHQPTGAGLANLAPPLLESDWLLGTPERPIRIVLHGVTGPINVNGTTWQLEMPGLAALGDEDIASILTYARREWEHTASPIGPAEVARVRAASADRAKAWSAEELNPATSPKTPIAN